MREHSPEAWRIASIYGHVLASETRDLAAHIDMALKAERERCAAVARNQLKAISDGIRGVPYYIPMVTIAQVEEAIKAPPP